MMVLAIGSLSASGFVLALGGRHRAAGWSR
jgi:hypothetical protein